ncbi:MAG TPA: hypothetical protein VGB45_03740 [Abditibacterium sp.]|jgi:hypothetical protein
MSEQTPQRPLDGAVSEAILNTEPPENQPPPLPLKDSENEPSAELEAWLAFDFAAYNLAFWEKISLPAARDDARYRAQIAGTQIYLSKALWPDVLDYLLQSVPAKSLWKFLGAKNRTELLQKVTKGFQRTPQIVRQSVVRSRLVQHFEKNPEQNYLLLALWSENESHAALLNRVSCESDEAEIESKLPLLIHKNGVFAVVAALCVAARPHAFRAIKYLLSQPEELLRLVDEAEQNLAAEAIENPSNETPASESEDESLPAPDSETAQFWKTRCEEAEARDKRRSETLEKLLDANESFMALIAQQKTALQNLEKSEQLATQRAEKKLDAVQKRLSLELDELRKNFERQNRKLRALEREKADLDLENRRFKKQLRHAGQLLEEERKKVALLEARLPREDAPPAPVASILTPAASQSAPNRPVVVQPPTPLDEIFEWRADGRAVKITPRAVRRLIDQNDEDSVWTLVQAIESLKHSNRSLHGKFLKRLGEMGAYYPRVLTESMTRVLVDASNVARHTPNRYGKGQMRHLLEMRDELRRLDCFPIIFYADASLRYFIDEATKFRDMVAAGEIYVVDKGIEADEILAREARKSGAYVVTNDAKFFHKVSPDFEPPRISFRIYSGTVIVDDF